MRTLRLSHWIASTLILLPAILCAQNRAARSSSAELRLHVQPTPATHLKVAAVVWLEPLGDTLVLPFTPQGHYTLLQKNRTFMPHLQVVPVGSVVQFPNADPFFHNVFSLFDGKRFDLGLYEAGSTPSPTPPTISQFAISHPATMQCTSGSKVHSRQRCKASHAKSKSPQA